VVPDIADTLANLARVLSEAGVRATIDPRDLNPPGVLVAAPTFRWTFGGRLSVDYRLLVVVPSAGAANDLKAIGALLDQISAVLAGAPVTATPSAWPDAGGGDPLPAYELAWTATTKE